ncbi:MAG: hypothetical protein ACJ71W_12035 [Terriglobales bacterium]
MKNALDIGHSEAWLRLRISLVRFSEEAVRKSLLRDLEVPFLVALACQEQLGYGYLNQKQLQSLLKKPNAAALSQTKSKLVKRGLCKPLKNNERRHLGLPVNERTKYYRITNLGRRALELHDRITGLLPPSITKGIQDSAEYMFVINSFDEQLQQYIGARFRAILVAERA